jgi:hypothetical protein
MELRWTASRDASAVPTPIQSSVSPSGDQTSSWLEPDQSRVDFLFSQGSVLFIVRITQNVLTL